MIPKCDWCGAPVGIAEGMNFNGKVLYVCDACDEKGECPRCGTLLDCRWDDVNKDDVYFCPNEGCSGGKSETM